jgi:hypothetical protein
MEALEFIVQKLGRIEHAVDFCIDHSDQKLWNRLVELAILKPEHVSRLLATSACNFVDPLSVIEKVDAEFSRVYERHWKENELVLDSRGHGDTKGIEVSTYQNIERYCMVL